MRKQPIVVWSTSIGSFVAAAALLASCGNLPGPKGASGDGGSLRGNACGDLSVSDAGRKYVAFIDATAQLAAATGKVESTIKDACVSMGRELQMTAGQLSGDTKTVCRAVFATLDDFKKVGIKAGAKLDVRYTPAVCTVDIEAAASAAAQCEGKASADIDARCSGTCEGTCAGTCNGTCAGSSKSGGSCNGQCDGTCQGQCQGECTGHADVKAEGQCRAKAEVTASVEAKCTPAKLDVDANAGVTIDKDKAERFFAALRAGVPTILSAGARLEALGAATVSWGKAAGELSTVGRDLATEFKAQAMCITGQVAAVASAATQIEASVSVSVEVSASASGSIGTN